MNTSPRVIIPLSLLLLCLVGCGEQVNYYQCPGTVEYVTDISRCPETNNTVASCSQEGCDDNNPCTRDLCSASTGFSCWNPPLPGCCQTSSECGTQAPYCQNSTCVACVLSEHCPPSQPFCIHGTCNATAACGTDEDCPPRAPRCADGGCHALFCTASSDCASREHCLRGICTMHACMNNSDCSEGEACVAHTCVQNCNEDSDCTDALHACQDGVCRISPILEGIAACSQLEGSSRAVCHGIMLAPRTEDSLICRELYRNDDRQGPCSRPGASLATHTRRTRHSTAIQSGHATAMMS
ncbi:MAG: hypothetical protein HC945_04220 [Nitrosarchaeum sp.]|nr:hypothetical protein [Nitrosarchaeum sp.]